MKIIKKFKEWYEVKKEERRLSKEYKKKLKEIKKRDPYTYK